MPRIVTKLATPAPSGPIELFPPPEDVVAGWSDEMAARLLPVARFDLALCEDPELSGTGVILYYEDVRCSFLEWAMQSGRIVEIDARWKQLRPFEERPSSEGLARALGGSHATLERHAVELPSVEQTGKLEWARRFEVALREQGARNPLGRLRLGGHPCYVQAEGYVDDATFVLAELPASCLELAPMYFYLFGDGTRFSQEMQMT